MPKKSSTLLVLSVRDFALPIPRCGSIESYSGYGKSVAEGQEIHMAIQQKRTREHSNYESEVPVRHEFLKGKYRFQVSGRMDGFFSADANSPARIEEIKTAFNLEDLYRKLAHGQGTHPYCLQLLTYGFFYWLEHQSCPELFFHLVSTRNGRSLDVKIELEVGEYEQWLRKRLVELEQEARLLEARVKRRKKASGSFLFPFPQPRSGQKELVESVEKALAQKNRLLIQAPTGLGKTVGVLYPTLKEALGRGQSVIYVTPKNSQHLTAEDAVERFQESGTKVRSMTLTAKSKICFKAEPLCNPDYCEFARDYYRKIDEHGLKEKLAKKKKLTSLVFRQLGEEYQVCPFELQLEAVPDADTVICDYNYVFSAQGLLAKPERPSLGQKGRPSLVIDEAHNLFSRGMDYYSPSLSSLMLEGFREGLKGLPASFQSEGFKLLDWAIQTLREMDPKTGRPEKIELTLEPFLEVQQELQSYFSRYLESDVEIKPKDPVLRLFFYWSEFTEILALIAGEERAEFFTTFRPHPTGGVVRIVCCDASRMLAPCYDEFEQVVGFSATLKPFDFYAKLSGLDPAGILTREFHSPFSPSRRKLMIIPQISTKFSQRERNYAKIAEVISRVSQIRPGNYLVFFPSFDFLEKTLGLFRPPPGFTVLKQSREMSQGAIESVLGRLRLNDSPSLLFAVQGGVFSEGIDYPGDMVIGAFVIGPPLPVFDIKREQMRHFYEEQYGAGFEYAYAFPAMAKAVQAAGRVIRSEADRGIIVLMDDCFLQPQYTLFMPSDWFNECPSELVSQSILSEVEAFWDSDRF